MTKKQIRLTYFTPTYNREKLLPNLYSSLLRQTDKNFIWLIIDDGSKDETEALVSLWQKENKIQIEYIKKEKGNKAVILILDDLHDSIESSENISWHYDTDFEFLNDDSIKQIIVPGVRHLDTYVRLRLADIPKRKIEHMKDEIDATKKIKLKNIDTIYILYDVYTVHLRDKVKDKLKAIIDKEGV